MRSGSSGQDARRIIQHIRTMASANLIHQFQAEIRAEMGALRESIEAQAKAQAAILRSFRWFVGIAIVIFGLLLTAANLLLPMLG